MIGCSIKVVTVLLGYLDLQAGALFLAFGARRLPTLPTPKAGPEKIVSANFKVVTLLCVRALIIIFYFSSNILQYLHL